MHRVINYCYPDMHITYCSLTLKHVSLPEALNTVALLGCLTLKCTVTALETLLSCVAWGAALHCIVSFVCVTTRYWDQILVTSQTRDWAMTNCTWFFLLIIVWGKVFIEVSGNTVNSFTCLWTQNPHSEVLNKKTLKQPHCVCRIGLFGWKSFHDIHCSLVSKCYCDFTGQPGFHGLNRAVSHGGRGGREREEGPPCSACEGWGGGWEGWEGAGLVGVRVLVVVDGGWGAGV